MNYSFRKKNKIVKYVVIHYTGMKSLKLAYKKLTISSSDVSIHYLVSKDGKIFNLFHLIEKKTLVKNFIFTKLV